ncbi:MULTISPECIES: chromosome segregation ATPase [Photobacterium]|nr:MULTISPECIES: chromosome segregation ATPase [Photobacterium]
MTSWKVSLVAGLVLGGILATAALQREPGPSQEAYDELLQKNAQLVSEQESMTARFEQFETDKALELEAINTLLRQKEEALDAQKSKYEQEIAQLKQQQQTIKKTVVVTKKKLENQVVELASTAEKQKKVLDNSKALYQQQLLLQKQVAQAEVDVSTAKRKAKEFKKACDEFKSGTSWNWVSQADCDKYEARLKAVDDAQAQQTALEQELAELNQKIDIEIPKP